MADNTLKNLESVIKNLASEIRKLKTDKTEAKKTGADTKSIDVQIKGKEKDIAATRKLINAEKERLALQKKYDDSFTSYSRRYIKFGSDVQKQLQGQGKSSSVYLNLGKSIAEEKKRQLRYEKASSDEEKRLLANSVERENKYSDISQRLESQAKATAKAEQDLRGISDIDREIEEIKKSQGVYSAVQKKELIESLELLKQLEDRERRIKAIKEQQEEVLGMMPGNIQQMVGFAKNLGAALKAGLGPIFIVGAVIMAALKSFLDLEESAAEFRKETGFTNSQMAGIRDQANQITQQFASIGVEAKDAFDTVAALKGEFSDVANFSTETVGALTVMNKNFGIAAESSAKVQGIFEQIGGLSSETAANVQLQVANMANLAGVAPAKVFKDIAENAEVASTIFKGDLTKLTKNAIEARRLGTNLKDAAENAERLLDFESSIEDELVAATYVGGQFNLSRARALAMEGDIVEAQKETLAQIQRSGDFRKQDYFTQKQLAKAAGMSVEEINKQLDAQEKLSNLSAEQKKAAEDAINAGLDITNISKENLASEVDKFKTQQEQQKTLDKISNQFMGIASTVGSVLVPVLDAVALALQVILFPITLINDMFGYIGEKIGALIGPLGTVGKVLKGLAGIAVIYAAYSAFQGIMAMSLGFGLPIAIAASAAIIAAGFGLLSKVGDLNSPADGKTQVSTKEGGLFELSPNDDLVAAPGAAAALANATSGQGGGSPQLNLSALAAPLNTMIGELKALRADLAAGKIAVRMDGAKVSAGIGNVVDGSTRNNYAMAQG